MAKEETTEIPEETASYRLTVEKTLPIVEGLRDMVMQELSTRIADQMSSNLMVKVPAFVRSACHGCGGNCKGSCNGSCKGGCYSCKDDCSGSCRGDCAGDSGRGSADNVPIKDIIVDNFTKLTFASVDSVRRVLAKEGYPY